MKKLFIIFTCIVLLGVAYPTSQRTKICEDDNQNCADVTYSQSNSNYNNRVKTDTTIGGIDSLAAFRRVNTVVRSDGNTALAVDSRTIVESTFGYDQSPDSFFRIINTGLAGTTWTIYIAGITADPSSPYRNIPAYSKVFTIQASEQGDELKFRDRIIQELNADTTFRNTCFLKAQKATDRGVVHIFSESFSLSGEFFERPNAGDFNVSIGGSPGDGVVIIGFDNFISRSKPVSITRDFDSPHRLGLFGITGDINVTPKQLSDIFIQGATLNNDGVTYSLTVNGSITPQNFVINASATTDVFIEEIRLFGWGNGIQYQLFLDHAALINGILIEIKSDNVVTQFPVLKTTADIKHKFAFGVGAQGFDLQLAPGNDDMIAVLTFSNPFILRVQGTFTIDDYIKITVRDDLSSKPARLEMWAKGFEKEP